MLSSDMNLDIKTRNVGYNNKILVSNGKFNLGKNEKVNSLELEPVISMPSHRVIAHAHELAQKPTITHDEERAASILFLTGSFAM